jgi:hypothetical protein
MAKLIWTVTGDELPLIPCNDALYEYFVNQLETNDINRYTCARMSIEESVNNLEQSLQEINPVLVSKFNITDLIVDNPNWLNQTLLNDLHRAWVKLHVRYPSIESLCEQIKVGSANHFYQINKMLHSLEQEFNDVKLTNQLRFFPNIFDEDITSFGNTNLTINFNNLGRTTLNKWVNFDTVVDDVDTNDFGELWTELTLNLSRSYHCSAPSEYVTWANEHGKRPSGEKIGLANVYRLEENLSRYRELLYTNSRIPQNTITLRK